MLQGLVKNFNEDGWKVEVHTLNDFQDDYGFKVEGEEDEEDDDEEGDESGSESGSE